MLCVCVCVSRSRVDDGSEQVKKELASIVGQLSCIQAEVSVLTGRHRKDTCPDTTLCLRLALAAKHAGNLSPSLRATVVRPFLPLLRQQSPSSVKQGASGFSFHLFFHNEFSLPPNAAVCHFSVWCIPAFLEALPHLCQHVDLTGGDSDSRAVLCALIGLMEDSDPAVRIRFSQSISFLLTESNKNPEQQGSLSDVRSFFFSPHYHRDIKM